MASNQRRLPKVYSIVWTASASHSKVDLGHLIGRGSIHSGYNVPMHSRRDDLEIGLAAARHDKPALIYGRERGGGI
jgi:hypothetical protein